MTNNNNNAPPTQLSASISTDSTQQNTDVLKGSSIIDDMFPLFTHVFQQVDIPLPLVFPFLLYFFSQVIAVSLWPWNSYWKDHDENHIVEEVRLVFFWIPKDANSTHFVIVSTVLFALNLISLILIIFQIEYFKIQRSFINFINISIRFYFDTILLVSLTPTTITIGESFLLMCTNEFHVQYVISIILSAFSLGYELFSFTIVQSFASKSIAISNSLLLNFDLSLMIECIGGMIASTLLYFILALFEPWARLIAIAMHAAWFAYMCQYITARLPFVAQLSSGLSLSWYLDNIFGDTLMIITHFYRNVNQWFLFGFVYLTFLVGAPPFLIYLNYKQKKIVKLMNEDLKNQDDANEYFISLGLSNNKVKVLLYLRTAFQFNCTCFYNWTLVKFIIEKYTDEAVLSTCLHFVNFFPKETHLLNRIRHIILQTRKIHFATRFLLYQVENIKTLRNYSVSSASKLKIIELKTMSKQCEMMTRAAVDSTKLTPTYFENLSYKARMTRAVWMEALQNAPNNPKFCEEFTRYLVECEADFDTAIRMKHRGQIIEMGRSFSVDYCFRSMIRVFPNYLKKEIVDFNGAIIDQNKRVANKASNSVSANGSNGGNSNDQSFGKSDDDFDNEVEEFVAKQTITNSRIRIALHRTLETKIPSSIKMIVPTSAIILVLVFGIFCFGYAFSADWLSGQTSSMNRLDYISQTRFYIALSNVDLVLQYSQEHGKLQYYIDAMKGLMRSTDPVFINVLDDMLREMLLFTNNASTKFQELINNIAELSLIGEDIYSFAGSLLKPEKSVYSCGGPRGKAGLYNISISGLIAMSISHQREFAGRDSVYNLMKEPTYCELFLNFQVFYEETTALFDKVCDYQKVESEDLDKIFMILSYIIPASIFFIVVVPVVVIHFKTVKTLKDIIAMIHSFDPKSKSEAKALISVSSHDDDTKTAEMQGNRHGSIILISIIFFISLSFLFISLIMCHLVVQANNSIIKLNGWNQYASLRLSLSAESLMLLIFSVAMHDIPESRVLGSIGVLVNMSLKITNQLVIADLNLTHGTDEFPPCAGFDKILDDYNIIDKPTKPVIGDPHDFYAQTSIHQQIDVYNSFVQSLAQDVLKLDEPVSEFHMANSIHVVNAHLWMRMMNVTKRLIKLADVEYHSMYQSIVILAVITAVLMIAFELVVYFYYKNRVGAYRASLFVLKRFHPMTLINNKNFAKFFLKSKDVSENEQLTVEGSIIHNANDAIFCTSQYGVVEVVNKSVSQLLGYTSEQILGQHVTTFFATQDEEKFQSKLEMMKSGQISNFCEEDFLAVTDSANEVPCHVSIFGMKSNNGDINSFVVILRDQTSLVEQMKQAEEAKAKSEKLLYQILPRDIVVQLNRGEKDITFTVNSATIIFIDIVRFSEYTVNLSPQDIMQNLSLYFAGIDKIASKYNMVTKIKLIGDIYMAAAGLFNPETSPESHAEQTVMLGLDSIAELDEINMRLDSSLTIRVGVNSGGPIIAGVLGTDKPAFDIIGDPINVAARLQSTDEANHVHISQATYDLINGLSFDIVARGETFLKGKGKQMTYFVNPIQVGLTSTGSFRRLSVG